MIRHICVAVFISIAGLTPTHADIGQDVADARELDIQGNYPAAMVAARHNYRLAGMLGVTAAWSEYGVLL